MKVIKYISLAILLVGVSACGPRLRPFTDRMYVNSGFSENELKRIQFYVSNDIVLQRRVDGTKARIESGKIKVIDGAQYEEIIIRRNTPGVFAFQADGEDIAVSFEGKPSVNYLVFGPSSRRNGEYVLRAAKWEREYGVVTYSGSQYTTPASSAFASLMVDVRGSGRGTTKVRRAGGNRVR